MKWPEKLYRIGTDEFLTGEELDVFVNFYLLRFPLNRSPSYASEWARRFRLGYEMKLGDSNSKHIITDLRHPFIALTEKGRGYK